MRSIDSDQANPILHLGSMRFCRVMIPRNRSPRVLEDPKELVATTSPTRDRSCLMLSSSKHLIVAPAIWTNSPASINDDLFFRYPSCSRKRRQHRADRNRHSRGPRGAQGLQDLLPSMREGAGARPRRRYPPRASVMSPRGFAAAAVLPTPHCKRDAGCRLSHPHQFRTRNDLAKTQRTRLNSDENTAKSTKRIVILPLITVWLQVERVPNRQLDQLCFGSEH
jgi:hypothetical protein